MPEEKDQFIGSSLILDIEENGDLVVLELKDYGKLTLTSELFGHVVSDTEHELGVADIIGHVLATKFVSELADNKLAYWFVDVISNKMRLLSHNMREQLFMQTFDCQGGDSIPLDRLVDSLDESNS